MSVFLLLVFVPIAVTWICRLVWPHKITWKEMAVSLVAGVAITAVVYGAGLYGQTADVEILNGQVTAKERKHDSYTRSYSCNCRQVCTGSGEKRSCSEKCSTCYEDRYTVTWNCHTNLGTFEIDKLDRSSRSVYNAPDPARYTSIVVGDPVAKRNAFTNYVKAVPESLFNKNKVESFKELIPAYPAAVFDFYRINRVLAMGVAVPDLAAWNQDLSMVLRKLGPQRQANAVVVFVNTADQSYLHALEGAWDGGKKNDIIIVIGTTAYPKIDWVGVSSWTDSQLFKVQLRDDIQALGSVDRAQIITALEKNTLATYVRKPMKDFEYLKNQIEPPFWVLILALVLGIVTSVGGSIYFHRNDPFTNGRSYRRFR